MGTLFDEVRSRVTALDAARMYGLEFDRSGRRARCIWHSPDRHPSLSFKGGYCRCFACNNGGSSIDLVAKLFGLSPLDAAKRLNEDFRLGLDVAPARRSNAPTLFERKQVFSQWRRAEMEKMRDDFAVFILTHGRADNVVTLKRILQAGNYTGKWYMIIDNEDDQAEAYIKKYGREHVVIFDKQAVDVRTDTADNFHEHRAIIYARNQSFYIAQELVLKYFLMKPAAA